MFGPNRDATRLEAVTTSPRQTSEAWAGSPEPVRRLPPATYSALAFQAQEDAAIWSRLWVGIGFAADLSEAGDVLPCTVGHHGIHVERLQGGALAGRFNKAQHGGCRVVPLQCRTGSKTRCSFTACGHSRDRLPIRADDPDRALHLDQYLGLRPERLWPVAVEEVGPLIVARLDPTAEAVARPPAADLLFDDDSLLSVGETVWREVACNWKHLGATASDPLNGDHVRLFFPNIVVRRSQGATVVSVFHPVALDRTLCRIRVFTHRTGASTDDDIDGLARWMARAEAAQASSCLGSVRGGRDDDARVRFEGEVLAALDVLHGDRSGGAFYRTSETTPW